MSSASSILLSTCLMLWPGLLLSQSRSAWTVTMSPECSQSLRCKMRCGGKCHRARNRWRCKRSCYSRCDRKTGCTKVRKCIRTCRNRCIWLRGRQRYFNRKCYDRCKDNCSNPRVSKRGKARWPKLGKKKPARRRCSRRRQLPVAEPFSELKNRRSRCLVNCDQNCSKITVKQPAACRYSCKGLCLAQYEVRVAVASNAHEENCLSYFKCADKKSTQAVEKCRISCVLRARIRGAGDFTLGGRGRGTK